MDFNAIKDILITKLKEPDYGGFKGSKLSLHLPVEEVTLNEILAKTISGTDGINEIILSDLNEDCFTVKIDHKKLNKTLRCRLLPLEANNSAEPELKIEFLDGVRFYEKLAVDTFNSVKKRWTQLKFTFGENKSKEPEKPENFWKLKGSGLTVHLNSLFQKFDLDYLVPLIKLAGISTQENKLVINLEIEL